MTTEALPGMGLPVYVERPSAILARDAATVTRLGEAIADRLHDGGAHTISVAGRVFKRTVDLLLATLALLLCLPLLVIAALAVRLDSRGPVIFRQVRTGRGGQHFSIYKLRTMHAGNDASAHTAYVTALISGIATSQNGMFKLAADPRVTRVGRVLRRYSVDELPQLINVLRGQMSLVGPRPAMPHEVNLYSDYARQRLQIKPGITGLWQVSGRCEVGFDDMVALDVSYAKAWSPALDLKIIAKTPLALVTGRGAA